MTRRLRAVAAVVTIAALGWLGCPRAPRPPLSVEEGMRSARPLPLRAASRVGSATLMGRVEGRIPADRSRADWWVLELPAQRGELRLVLGHRGRKESATLEALDEHGQRLGVGITLPAVQTPVPQHDSVPLTLTDVSGRVFVRVYAIAAPAPEAYQLSAEYAPNPPSLDAGFTCDARHVDPQNPACDGVQPWCDPNQPDFDNPDCCWLADCAVAQCFGNVGQLTRRDASIVGRLDRGRVHGVVVGAGAELSIWLRDAEAPTRGGALSILDVEEDFSNVEVWLPDQTPVERIVSIHATLFAPPACITATRAGD